MFTFVLIINSNTLMFKKIKSYTFLSLIILALLNSIGTSQVFGQQSVKDSTISMHLIMGQAAYQFPGGDLAKRFGSNAMVGAGYIYKSSGNWFFGAEAGYLFGNQVKNESNILSNIETSDGNLIDTEGIYANYRFNQSGFLFLGKFGKVMSIKKPNKNSGLMLGIGAGMLQHKIFIEHRDQTAPQISGDYVKGYDELKRGPAVNISAGYLFLGNKRIVNFYTGIDYTIAFTENVRPYSFNQMKYNTDSYTDNLFSIKIGWIIPIYKRAPKEFYFY